MLANELDCLWSLLLLAAGVEIIDIDEPVMVDGGDVDEQDGEDNNEDDGDEVDDDDEEDDDDKVRLRLDELRPQASRRPRPRLRGSGSQADGSKADLSTNTTCSRSSCSSLSCLVVLGVASTGTTFMLEFRTTWRPM